MRPAARRHARPTCLIAFVVTDFRPEVKVLLDESPAEGGGDRFGAIARAKLAEDVADVRFDRSFPDEKFCRDFLIGAAAGEFGEDVEFASGEPVGTISAPDTPFDAWKPVGCELPVGQRRVSSIADRFQDGNQGCRGNVLPNVGACPGRDRPSRLAVIERVPHQDHLDGGSLVFDVSDCLYRVAGGILVQEHNVGPEFRRQPDGVGRRGSFSHDFHFARSFQQRSNGVPDKCQSVNKNGAY